MHVRHRIGNIFLHRSLTTHSNSIESHSTKGILMARPPSQHPTDGELEILRVLWDRGPSSLSEICEGLGQSTRCSSRRSRPTLGRRIARTPQTHRFQSWLTQRREGAKQ